MCRLISAQFSQNDFNSDGDCVGLSTAPCSDSVMTVTNSMVLGRYGDGANDDDWVLVCIVRTVVPSR